MKFIYLFLLFISVANSSAGEWKLEVLNIQTREVKNFIPLDGAFTIPIPLDGFECRIEVEEGSSRALLCLYGKRAVAVMASKQPQYGTMATLMLFKPMAVKGKNLIEKTFRLVLEYANE